MVIGLNQAVAPMTILEFSGKHMVAEHAAKDEGPRNQLRESRGVHRFLNANPELISIWSVLGIKENPLIEIISR